MNDNRFYHRSHEPVDNLISSLKGYKRDYDNTSSQSNNDNNIRKKSCLNDRTYENISNNQYKNDCNNNNNDNDDENSHSIQHTIQDSNSYHFIDNILRISKQGDCVTNYILNLNTHIDTSVNDLSIYDEPLTHEQAMKSEQREAWRDAEQSEISSLKKNKVFKVVSRPSNRKIIPCKWIYKIKTDSTGKPVRYKARLVIKGYHQVLGQDYDQTFSPVARLTSIRLIYSISMLFNLKLQQLDVDTAFLNADLEDNIDIYVEPPPAMELLNGQVYKLQKSLYGLKQAPRDWNNNINKFLLEI
jgi:hypothetical protein